MSLLTGWFELDVYRLPDRFVIIAEQTAPGMSVGELKRAMLRIGADEMILPFTGSDFAELVLGTLRTLPEGRPPDLLPRPFENERLLGLKVWSVFLKG